MAVSPIEKLIKWSIATGTTDSYGNLILSNYAGMSAINVSPVRGDSGYYNSYYSVMLGTSANGTPVATCIDQSGNKLTNANVKLKVFYL